MSLALLGLAAMLRGVDMPGSHRRPPSREVARDLENETRIEMLLRRLRAARPTPDVDAQTEGHLQALLSR